MLNKINFSIINEIQERADIVSVISQYIKLNRKGNNYVGICPFHPDTNPSLTVSPKKKIFKCFVCGAKGNVFSFVQQYKKISFIEAVKIVGEFINYDTSKLQSISHDTYLNPQIKKLIDLNQLVQEWYHGFLFNPENKSYLDYLLKRGLTKEIIDEYEFGYATKSSNLIYSMATNKDDMFGEQRDKSLIFTERELLDAGLIILTSEQKIIDFFIDRIVIPIKDNNGYVVGFSGRSLKKGAVNKYLNTPTTKLFSKANVLFNFDKVKFLNPTKLIIVEGPMDAIAYIRTGHKNVVATMGTSLSTHHLNLLRTLTSLETIILSFDNDNAGNIAATQHGKTLMENGFNTYVVGAYDASFKDIDELLNAKGPNQVNDVLNQRRDFVTFLIENEFKNQKPLDEIQKSVNFIIESMLNFGDNSLLLRTKNLKLLSEKSGLEFNDLLDKFTKDEQKLFPQSTNYKKARTFKPTNDVGLDNKFVEQDKKEPTIKVPKMSNVSILVKENLSKMKLISKSLASAYDYLISILLSHSQFIDYFQNEMSLIAHFEFPEQETILKTIRYRQLTNEPIDEQAILKYMQQRSQEGNSNVSKTYAKAFAYLQNHLTSIDYEYFKKINSKNSQQRLEETIFKLQKQQYEFNICKEFQTIYELYIDNPYANANKITLSFARINDFKQRMKELLKVKASAKHYN
jgi:DNA primase